MARYCIGQSGTVINVVEADSAAQALGSLEADVFLDPTGSTNVGAAYDVRDVSYDRLDVVTHKIIFQIIKGTIAVPQPSITAAQYKTYVKNQMT